VSRKLDPDVDAAIATATLSLLAEHGFAAMTMEALAEVAAVGKPTLYRRYPDKATLVAAVIAGQLPELEVADRDDTRAELWEAVAKGLPADGPAYLRLIGGLVAEEKRHPDLIEAFRANILLPRRAVVIAVIERGKDRGEVGDAVDAEAALDAMAGAFLARAFAGLDVGPRWRARAFESWWETIREGHER
jgi:AcrR family transcriptional regulator